MHADEPDVVEATCDKGRQSKMAKHTKIQNLGKHKHNCDLLRNGVGTLIVTYRPKDSCSPQDYGLCQYCYAYLVRRDVWKHRCQLKPTVHGDEPKQKRKRNEEHEVGLQHVQQGNRVQDRSWSWKDIEEHYTRSDLSCSA